MSATPNADASELDKFGDIAHHWWDLNSEFKALHDINPLRLDWIDKQAEGLSGKKVLDVGCGGGVLAEGMASRGAEVTGIDLSGKALGVARLHLFESELEIDYRHISAEAFAEEHAGRFDIVTCMEMLEHVPDPASSIAACARLVRPGGRVFLSTLNRNPKSFLFAIVGAEYVLKILPRGIHNYNRFLKPSELARFCRDAGLLDTAMSGLTYNPFTRIYSLSRDTSVNYLMQARRPA
ncbi:MAG: bifunctional 2-polyprenyl-6-hydroxyphenol methylase/3-demethylubiquinol 3-O-methyltransferase UbiG [Azoarcus sp.]|jgi:2-polyprenyl-6-hydroxyphenyl methylase/3-demethylubiquinone-9 3-methyltransferase|nr:bifunctional 2-polyprenyl-6-hydroxyphenol methylase/3-demethylubiquinol 3-O-methyltransferase UbiG [Azoarcus sp.]